MNTQQLTLPVEGMTCASCVRTIERALSRVPGVAQATVNFATERATIVYDPTLVRPNDLVIAIADAGYQVHEVAGELAEETVEDRERAARQAEVAALRRRFLVALVLSVPIFLGSYPMWFRWVPDILTNWIVLLALTTPVQFWAGWPFYKGAWAALKHKTSDMNTLIAVGTSAAYIYSVAATFAPQLFPTGLAEIYKGWR